MNERIDFHIGWDYAHFNIYLPDTATEQMLLGFNQGKAHFGKKYKQSDIFDRKWLLLRLNASRRNRIFDDEVTPEFLYQICPEICPVSGCALTTRTLQGSDWSVDRIVNDGAYTPLNLMVVSTRVNMAKGSKSHAELRSLMLGETTDDSLSQDEWRRLYLLCQPIFLGAGLMKDSEYIISPILQGNKPDHLPVHYTETIQYCLIGIITGLPKTYRSEFSDLILKTKQLSKSCNDLKSNLLLKSLLKKIERRMRTKVLSDVMNNEKIMSLFIELNDYQVERGAWPPVTDQKDKDAETNTMLSKGDFTNVLSLKTRGYIQE